MSDAPTTSGLARLGKVGLTGSAMAEGLVWSDRVVDVAEPVDLDGESVAVGDVGAVEVFVLEGAEEPFDDAVRLRRFHAGAHVPQERIFAVEGGCVRGPLSVTTEIGAGTRPTTESSGP